MNESIPVGSLVDVRKRGYTHSQQTETFRGIITAVSEELYAGTTPIYCVSCPRGYVVGLTATEDEMTVVRRAKPTARA